MKKFLKYVLIVILFSAWGIILTNKEQTREAAGEIYKAVSRPCRKPLKYSIGEVDPKFGVSREDLVRLSREAESVWENSSGKDLFQYESEAPFKINLIFDERQASTLEAKRLEQELKNLEASRNALDKKYSSLSSAYKQKIDGYNKALREYKKDLEEYNSDVDYWNEKGGAPEDEFEKLEKKRKRLKDAFEELDEDRKEINKLVSQTNKIAGQENEIVNDYNSNLNTYKSEFGDAREFEKGEFLGKEINIYQFQKEPDLELTIIHEMGHYLGIGHVENSKSAMYYLIGDQDLDSLVLTSEDVSELKKVCKLN